MSAHCNLSLLRLRRERRHPRVVQESVRGRVRQDREQEGEEEEREGEGLENPDRVAVRIRRKKLWENVRTLTTADYFCTKHQLMSINVSPTLFHTCFPTAIKLPLDDDFSQCSGSVARLFRHSTIC